MQVRKLRNDYGLVRQRPHLYVATSDAAKAGVLSRSTLELATLSSSEDVTVLGPGASLDDDDHSPQ